MIRNKYMELMITRSVLCPAEVPSGIKLPNISSQTTEFHHLFFTPHLLASLKAIECNTGSSSGTNISKLSKLNFASGRTGRTAGPASSTLVKLSLNGAALNVNKTMCDFSENNLSER